MSNPTPREWQTHTQRRADDLAGTNEGDRLAAEATRYGEVADHIEALQHETEAQYKLIERQGEILRAVVNAVRGAHPDGGRWSTHDAAELVLAVVAERDAALADACRAYDKLNGLHISARAHRDRVRELTAERDALRAELAAPRAQEPAGELIGHIDFGSDQPSTPVYTAPQPAAGPAGKSTNDQFCDVVQFNGVTIKHDAALQPAAAPRHPLTDAQIDDLMPPPDGTAEVNVIRLEVLPGVMGTEFEEADAWSRERVIQTARAIERAHGIGHEGGAA